MSAALEARLITGMVSSKSCDAATALSSMDKKRRQWARRGLYLYYLPPYSPELNRNEILWKHAKYFWHRFVAKNGADLVDEIQSLMRGFGSKSTINFA